MRTLPKIIPAAVLTALVAFTGAREGLRLASYRDVGGVPTICYGDTSNVRMGQTATKAECAQRLQGKLTDAYEAVGHYVTAPLSGGEQEAYTDFTYNVGQGAFARSTLVKKLNAGDHKGACAELLKWVYVQQGNTSVLSNGLKSRRAAEYKLCMRDLH